MSAARRLGAGIVGLLAEEASTRSSALLRVGVVLLLWSRFAAEWSLFMDLEPWKVALSTSFYASTTLFLVGFASRLTGLWTAANGLLLAFWVGVHKGVEPYQHHHVMALVLGAAIIALLPTGGSLSVDRWRAVRRAARLGLAPPPERGPTWARHLLTLHLVCIYAFGSLAKLSPAYLRGDRFTHYLMRLYIGSDLPEGAWFGPLMAAVAWGSVLIEPFIAVGLLVPRLRGAAIITGLVFHGLIYWTLPVGTFSLTMGLFYLAAVPPDAVDAGLRRLAGRGA
ncbi:MAG: hypothetical protein RL071_1019 [Pseudomonadota bacterium]|jgi:hypothetical protein